MPLHLLASRFLASYGHTQSFGPRVHVEEQRNVHYLLRELRSNPEWLRPHVAFYVSQYQGELFDLAGREKTADEDLGTGKPKSDVGRRTTALGM